MYNVGDVAVLRGTTEPRKILSTLSCPNCGIQKVAFTKHDTILRHICAKCYFNYTDIIKEGYIYHNAFEVSPYIDDKLYLSQLEGLE